MRFFRFLFFLLTSQIVIAQQQCFVRVDSTVRRDVVRVAPSGSQTDCNIKCVETPGCEACMLYVESGNCVMMGPARALPPGTCPRAYACYVKQYSGCPVRSPPAVDRCYTPGPCSQASDIVGFPIAGGSVAHTTPLPVAKSVCGPLPPIGQRRIVLDHDGTRMVLENLVSSFVEWDSYVGSWYYSWTSTRIYIKCATCVTAPASALLLQCDCTPLPSEPPIPGATLNGKTVVTNGSIPICALPSNYQIRVGHITFGGLVEARDTQNRHTIRCTMGEWMLTTDQPYLTEHTILSATCIV